MASFEFSLNGGIEEIAERVLGGKETKLFMAERAAEYLEPYVPRDTGFLAESAEIDENGIVYAAPYAEEQYHWAGVRKSKNPLASSYWDKTAMESRYDDLLRDLEGRIKGHG